MHLPRVGKAGGVFAADLPCACGLVAAVDLVGGKGGHVHRVRERAVRVVEGERRAVRVDAEGGVYLAAGSVPLRAVAVDEQMFAGGEGDVRQRQRGKDVFAVHEAEAAHVFQLRAGVDKFHPIAEGAAFIAVSRGVAGHDLAQAQGRIGSGRALIRRAARGHQRVQREARRQRKRTDERQRQSAAPGLRAPPVFALCGQGRHLRF